MSSLSDKKEKAFSAKITRQKKANDDTKSITDSVSSYFNVTQEENIKNLQENLNGESYESKFISEFLEERQNIDNLIDKEEMNELKKNSSNFDDEIFEEKVLEIFTKNFDLDVLNIDPFLEVVNSTKRKKKITQISYFKIKCEINNKFSYFYLLCNRKTYLIKYFDLIIILTKSQGIINSISVMKNNYMYARDFILEREGRIYKIKFQYREIIPELISYIKEIHDLKNELNNSKDVKGKENENKIKEEKIKILEDIKNILEKKYSKDEINRKIEEKNEDLKLIQNKIKYNKLMEKEDNELEKQNNLVKSEIEKLQNLLIEVTIKVEKIEKELDGFFISTKEMALENTIGDKLIIPKNRPIIVEVKNNSNYQNIIENIREKKKLIKLLGLNDDLFYFVGILREIKIDKIEKENINEKLKKFNFFNTIVIYPENSTFFGISIIKKRAEFQSPIYAILYDIQKKLDLLLTEFNDFRKNGK